MRLGKFEKQILICLMDNFTDGKILDRKRYELKEFVGKILHRWLENPYHKGQLCLNWSFEDSFNRAIRSLKKKNLLSEEELKFGKYGVWQYLCLCLTPQGRLVARGIKISRAKMRL